MAEGLSPTEVGKEIAGRAERVAGLERDADDLFDRGSSQESTSDKYIRRTMFLASVDLDRDRTERLILRA